MYIFLYLYINIDIGIIDNNMGILSKRMKLNNINAPN